MKIKSTQKSSKKAVLIAIVLLVLASLLTYGVYAKINSAWPFANESSTGDNGITNTEQNDTKNPHNTTNQDNANPGGSPKSPVNNEVPKERGSSDTIPVTITSADQEGGNLRIRTLIEKISNNGSCSLKLTHDGQEITKTSEIQPLPSSSTCKGFSIPLSQLSKGSWNISLSVTADEEKGSAVKTVTIN